MNIMDRMKGGEKQDVNSIFSYYTDGINGI